MRQFLVFQITSRRNYDVADILHSNNQLAGLVTDFYCRPKSNLDIFISIISPKFYNFFSKYKNESIDEKLVYRSLLSGFIYRFYLRFLNKSCQNFGLRSAGKILNRRSRNVPYFDAVYGYDVCSLEAFNENFGTKMLILEQCVAPRRSQIEMYKLLSKKYSINFDDQIKNCQILQIVEEKEWLLSNKIVCPSGYVKKELINAGVEESKIDIVPYGFSNSLGIDEIKCKINEKKNSEYFNILFVGNEAVRKGVLDIIETASKLLAYKNIKFHLVGQIENELSSFNSLNLPDNIKIHGKLNINELSKVYLDSNLFFLPSYLEGSAFVNYEALSYGLPLLTTFESGSVTDTGVDGYIVSAGNVDQMVNHIIKMCDDREVFAKMSFAALEKSSEFTLGKYKSRLIVAINN